MLVNMELKQLSFVCCWREWRAHGIPRRKTLTLHRIVDIELKKNPVIKRTQKKMRCAVCAPNKWKTKGRWQDEGVVILFTRIHSSSTRCFFYFILFYSFLFIYSFACFSRIRCVCARASVFCPCLFSFSFIVYFNLIRVYHPIFAFFLSFLHSCAPMYLNCGTQFQFLCLVLDLWW